MKTSYRKAIERADIWFSKYVRLFYSQNGLCRCVTCGDWKDVKAMDNGHFMSRRHLNTRWTFENCGPQDTYCNRHNQGENQKMADFLDDKFGKGTAEKMKIKALSRGQKLTEIDIRFIADYWRESFNELVKTKGNPWKK